MIDLPLPQQTCLAQAVYHEARGESERGQRAVAHVIINRSKDRGKPPCVIIRQPGQFHFKPRKSYAGPDWIKALNVVRSLGSDPTRGALFFHSTGSNPRWKLRMLVTIGRHIFYK